MSIFDIYLASQKHFALVFSGTSVCDYVTHVWALQCLKKDFQVPKTIRVLWAKNNESSLWPTHADMESSRIDHVTDGARGVAGHAYEGPNEHTLVGLSGMLGVPKSWLIINKH